MSAATVAVTKEPASLKRWAVRFLVVVGGLVVLVWAAPMIAAHTPLVSWACREAEKHVDGRIHVGTVSLGWFSPVVLTNVEIRDAGEHTIVHIPKIASDRCLLRLLMDRDDFGSFRLEKPTIDITFTGTESGLEKVLARYWPEPGNAAAGGPAVDVDDCARAVRPRRVPRRHLQPGPARGRVEQCGGALGQEVGELTLG